MQYIDGYGKEEVQETKPEALHVTSLEKLRTYAGGFIVELPPFGDGQPFVARVRQPSMLKLASSGKIPNSLLNSAGELFTGGVKQDEEGNMLPNLYDVMHIMAEATFIEPTLEEIESVGLELTDEQYMAIMQFSQQGVKALESFRQE